MVTMLRSVLRVGVFEHVLTQQQTKPLQFASALVRVCK